MKNRLRIFAGILWFFVIPCIYFVAYCAQKPATWYNMANSVVGIMVLCGSAIGGMACMIESSETR